MDKFKQTGKSIKKKAEESQANTRRISENFPLIERKVDDVIYTKSFKMDFPLTGNPHTVKMDLAVRSPNCFQCNPGYAGNGISCVADAPSFGPNAGDGDAHPGIYSSFSSNTGGFSLDPSGGIIVPADGYYNCRFVNQTGGVVVASIAVIIASVRHNGIVKAQQIVKNAAYTSFDLYGICILCREGDVLGGWFAATGIAFFSPSNLCFGGCKTTVTQIGLP